MAPALPRRCRHLRLLQARPQALLTCSWRPSEEEEQGFVEDQVVEPWENPEFLRECLKCHCRSYLRKGGCCNPACAPCFSICTYESFNRRQNLVSLSVVAFRVFICCFCLSHAQALYYVHRKDWAYWQKGKSAKKSWTGDKQGMVKCIVASRKKKSLAMKEAKKQCTRPMASASGSPRTRA